MTKFHLLDLPFLAIDEILRQMTLFDMVNFSLTSSKAKVLTKSIILTQKTKYEIEITIDSLPKLGIRQNPKGSYYTHVYEMTSDRTKSEVNLCSHTIQKYSEDVLDGFRKWSDYVMDVLSGQVTSIGYHTDVFRGRNKSIIDWLKSISDSVESVSIGKSSRHQGCYDHIVIYILQNLKVTKHLSLDVHLSKNFDPRLIPKNLKIISIQFSRWITLEHLLNLDSSTICLTYLQLMTIQDFSRFFMSWMKSESNLNLTDFRAEIPPDYDFNRLVEGVPHERIGHDIERDLLGNGQMIKGGVDIIRNDGKRATVFVKDFVPFCRSLFMIVH